jgi:hypothetical protein
MTQKIKKYDEFVGEAISGTEVPTNPNFSYFGAAYGTDKSPNTINTHNTKVVTCTMNNEFYTEDKFLELREDFITNGGDINSLPGDGFCQENVDFMVDFLSRTNP